MNHKDVEKGGESKFAVGDFKGVAAFAHVPLDERVKVRGVKKVSVEPKCEHVDHASDRTCPRRSEEYVFEGKGGTIRGGGTQQVQPGKGCSQKEVTAVARFDKFKVLGTNASDMFRGDPG